MNGDFLVKRYFCFVLSVLLICTSLFFMSSCGKGKVLDTLVSDTYKYKLYGNDTVTNIEVYKDSKLIFETKISGVITANGTYEHYGFIHEDMNFDGSEDFALIVSAKDGKIKYNCYTYDTLTATYTKNQYLSSLENISFDSENENVIEMQVSKIYDQPILGNNDPLDYTVSKTKIIYKWAEGVLTEQSRASLVYYSESDIYSYITYTFDSNGKAEEDTELWLEPSEIEAFLAEIQW